MPEVDCIDFAGKREVCYAASLFFGQCGNHLSGFTHEEGLTHLGY